MRRWGPASVLLLAALLLAATQLAAAAPAGRHLRPHRRRLECDGDTRVLLLGSYPAEVSRNLSAEQLAPGQPTVVGGHDFYLGTLRGARVIIGLSEQSPADAQATAALALTHFACVSAVVMEGTAGGGSGGNLGDVTVPSEWEYQGQSAATPVSATALALARAQAAAVDAQLLDSDTVADGDCGCGGSSDETVTVRTKPRDLVGGLGFTDDTGTSDTCTAGGGELEGCNPCPPCPVQAAAELRREPAGLLATMRPSRRSARDPARRLPHATSPAYVADDQQTAAVQAAADAAYVPFIAFRGISDTLSQGDAYPLEFAVYQHLAADNAAIAAADWIAAWNPAG